MSEIWSNPLFGVLLTVFSFYIGGQVSKKIKSPIANPLLIAMVICVLVMKVLHISYDDYMEGAQFVSMFLVPVTAMLGLSIYRQRAVLKEQFFPIVIGCLLGSILSMGSTVILCRMLVMHEEMIYSLLPKSVTTAIEEVAEGKITAYVDDSDNIVEHDMTDPEHLAEDEIR